MIYTPFINVHNDVSMFAQSIKRTRAKLKKIWQQVGNSVTATHIVCIPYVTLTYQTVEMISDHAQ